ncbi:MAG: hypothetical protein K2M97_01975, partial [Muribaculaceae bacterium]|nr:hypothetical protein [Muribaculaceae bacterium]
RFKIDWNNIDPAGQYSTASGAKNQIDDNGGYLVDFMIHVKPAKIRLSAATTDHGNLCLADGTEITEEGIELDADNEIRLATVSTDGTTVLSVVARHGYHHELAANFMGNNYWSEAKYSLTDEGLCIPANKADRHLSLSVVEFDLSSLTDLAADKAEVEIYDLMGRRVANPSTGIYIVNGRKQAIR